MLSLRGVITAAGMNMDDLAEEINAMSKRRFPKEQPVYLTGQGISQRFSGRTEWRLKEAILLCDVVGIPYADIPTYFWDDRALA